MTKDFFETFTANKDLIKDFFLKLRLENTSIQVGCINHIDVIVFQDKVIEYLENNQDKNLYFLANVKNEVEKNRASDKDISQKNYIAFDFDVRKYFQEKEKEISDDEIKKWGRGLGEKLNKTQTFKGWNYIIFTGNGIHLYYIGTPIDVTNSQAFSGAMKMLMKDLTEFSEVPPDTSCSNTARIFRMPGSYHNKQTPPKLVSFVAIENEKNNMMETVKEKMLEYVAKRDFDNMKKALKVSNPGDSLFHDINNIPIEQEILKDFPGWSFDGKNFRDSNGMASFWKSKENFLIKSDSRWINGNEEWYSTYTYRKSQSNLTDKETVEYFKNEYNLEKNNNSKNAKKFLEAQEVYQDDDTRYTWGTDELNHSFGIIKRESYIVLAAETSHGKTTFAFDMALKNGELGHKVLYLSLEMSKGELIDNIARSSSRITIEEEYKKEIPEKKMIAFEKKRKELSNIKNVIVAGLTRGSKDMTWGAIEELIKSMDALDLIFIDNLGAIPNAEDLEIQRKISLSIMNFTSNYHIPVVLINHYRKKSGGSSSIRSIDDIRGSGKITHDANYVVSLRRDLDTEGILSEKERASTLIQLIKARGYKNSSKIIYFHKGSFYDEYPEKKPFISSFPLT